MRHFRIVVLAIWMTVMFSGLGIAAIINSYSIASTGIIKNGSIEVYHDQYLTSPMTALDWEPMDAGGHYFVVGYVKNVGNVNLTLTIEFADFNPVNAGTILTLGWNYSGQVLDPDAVLPVQFSCTVAADTLGIAGFSYTTRIVWHY